MVITRILPLAHHFDGFVNCNLSTTTYFISRLERRETKEWRRILTPPVMLDLLAPLAPAVTLEQINQSNRRFWNDQHRLLKQRMSAGAIRDAAFELLRAEHTRALPIRYQTSLYAALENAERLGKQVLAEHARKGGKAKKTDTLQMLIEQLVQRVPSITVRKLRIRLEAHQGIDIIQDIDGDSIWFNNHSGRSKEAKLSGLKHRLARAKRKFRSR